MNIIYDFESDDDIEDKKRYARPILDGDNDKYYGFGYCYEYDDIDPVFYQILEKKQC